MMRQLVVLAAVAGLVLARPETYREKEDFQFSRSSSDEGSKSGFYGAQRGNMGGNYERAHNMDPLAQNQMSGLVRTVEGELGDGAKQKTGSIYTAANSRGVYGSGHYDLSNLEGRNFQEGASFGAASGAASGSQSQSALTSQQSASNSAGYGSSQSHSASYGSQTHDSRYRGYNSAGNSEQAFNSNNLQQQVQHSGNLQSVNQYEDRNNAHNSGYYSQAAGYQGQGYDQGSSLSHTSNAYGSDIHSRLVSGTPVRIVIRPGTRVILPVAAQTYDASQSAGSFDQNAINSETEVLHGTEQQVALKPKTKNFESSYSYRKEWEKHDTRPLNGAAPLAIPSVTPYPANSELYEDAQALEQQQQQSSHSSHHSSHSGYNVNSASSRQAVNNAQHSSGVNTGSNAYHAYSGDSGAAYDGAYNRGASGAYNAAANGASSLNQVDDSNTKPKSYQSSYSYHKSWEHQGDPYVIKPSTNGLYDGQASGKMTAASLNQGAYDSSHQYGSQHQSHQSYSRHSNSDADCDENGHTRVVRSYNAHQNEALTRGDSIDQEELGQRTQKQRNTFSEDLGQQTQSEWDNLKELGQQTQATWEQLGQQTVNKWDNLKDEGQQTQMLWGQQETGKKWDKIEDLGQHQTIQWDPNDAGQQTQNTWDKLESGPQSQKAI
ncbi:Reticulocyte-binding protein 2-like protein, partial [Operophtera brumata]